MSSIRSNASMKSNYFNGVIIRPRTAVACDILRIPARVPGCKSASYCRTREKKNKEIERLYVDKEDEEIYLSHASQEACESKNQV